jgi:hypothetical protein
MYDQCEDGLVASGNTVRYKHFVHKDANGRIVDNESLAFGHPVTIYYVHPDIFFFLMKPEIIRMGKRMGTKAVRGKLFQEEKFQQSLLE